MKKKFNSGYGNFDKNGDYWRSLDYTNYSRWKCVPEEFRNAENELWLGVIGTSPLACVVVRKRDAEVLFWDVFRPAIKPTPKLDSLFAVASFIGKLAKAVLSKE